ncbi:MAG: DUF1344 domain-containing protein [bacterium]
MSVKIASALAIIASLGVSGTAMAYSTAGAQQDTGFITSIDETDKTVTLSDGNTYQLPNGVGMALFAEGQKLAVDWTQNGGTRTVESFHFGS